MYGVKSIRFGKDFLISKKPCCGNLAKHVNFQQAFLLAQSLSCGWSITMASRYVIIFTESQ